MSFIKKIPLRSRPTYFWYTRAQMLDGVYIGAVFQMVNYVGRKTMEVSEFQVMLFHFFMYLGMLIGFLLPSIFNIRSKMQYITWTAIPCKLLFLSLAFVMEPYWFFVLASAALFLSKIHVPMIIAVLQNNFPDSHRGTIVGHVRSKELGCSMLAAGLAGYWMDINAETFRFIFPAACLSGIAGTWMFLQIRERHVDKTQKIIPLSQLLGVVKQDRIYMVYQVLFSISGVVNLMGIPLYILYTVDVIHADYFEIALSTGILFSLCSMLTLRWWGRLVDRHPNPILIRAVLSLLWCIHPLCFVFAKDMTMVYVANAWFGFLLAGGSLNWMLGPLFFCSDETAHLYTSIHSWFNGLRGTIAPVLGYFLYNWLGYVPTFWIISLVMFVNSFMIYFLYLYTRHKKRFQTYAV